MHSHRDFAFNTEVYGKRTVGYRADDVAIRSRPSACEMAAAGKRLDATAAETEVVLNQLLQPELAAGEQARDGIAPRA